MQFGVFASDPRAAKVRLRPHFDGTKGHSSFPQQKNIFPIHLQQPHFFDNNPSIPPCDSLNKRFTHVHLVIFVLSLGIFFLLRRVERPRGRLSTWILDLLRQSIASVVSSFLFLFVLYMSMDFQEYWDPTICRLPVVSFFFQTFIGLPLLYLAHKFVFAVARRISLGRARYVLNDEIARVGLQSGNYGQPVRFSVFVKQTLLLCSAFIFTKFFTSFLLYSVKSLDGFLVVILLGWTWRMGQGAEILMAKAVYPLIFWTIQYVAIDRIIRYSPPTARKCQSDLEEALDRYEQGEEAGVELGGSATIDDESTCIPLQAVVDMRPHSETATSPESSPASSPRHFAPSTTTSTSILTTLLTAPLRMPSVTSPDPSCANGHLGAAEATVAQAAPPPSYITPPISVHPLEMEPGAEEELPTYADSQRQALESRERDRQRIMDLKQH
ncbi:uncharacterized protein V1513DRAFT_248789 [Lipomyces chichibuensis]|uniref:uncharacterized protein n=1 Tax=Lipomyces chichibuensis TaxID=1546026 RepID=UPI00334394CF